MQIYAFDRKTYPSSKFGFMTYQTDSVLPGYFLMTEAQLAARYETFVTSIANRPNTRLLEGALEQPFDEADTTAEPYILPWVTQLVNDDAAWADAMH